MARPNPLADPDFAQQVAEVVAEGATRQVVADCFGVQDLDTITRWKRDPRVKSRVEKIVRDRVTEVHRKVDSVIAARLQDAHELTLKDLLDIRKEFLGGALRNQTEKADDATVAEAREALENNPGLVDELAELLSANDKGALDGATKE